MVNGMKPSTLMDIISELIDLVIFLIKEGEYDFTEKQADEIWERVETIQRLLEREID